MCASDTQALLPESLELPWAPTASLPPGCVCSALTFGVYCCLSALWLSSRHHLTAKQIQMQPAPRMERHTSLGFVPVSYILIYHAMVVLQISPYKEIPRKNNSPQNMYLCVFCFPFSNRDKYRVPLKEMNDCLGSISLYCVQLRSSFGSIQRSMIYLLIIH